MYAKAPRAAAAMSETPFTAAAADTAISGALPSHLGSCELARVCLVCSTALAMLILTTLGTREFHLPTQFVDSELRFQQRREGVHLTLNTAKYALLRRRYPAGDIKLHIPSQGSPASPRLNYGTLTLFHRCHLTVMCPR